MPYALSALHFFISLVQRALDHATIPAFDAETRSFHSLQQEMQREQPSVGLVLASALSRDIHSIYSVTADCAKYIVH